MNRLLIFMLLMGLLGCDTSNNITPIGDAYFLKFYGSSGDQEGISVKATPDGGYIIGGNSVADFGGQSDYLLIKVNAFGNQEWMQTYDFNGTLEDDFLTEVLIDGNGFTLVGTSYISGIPKMVLMQIGQSGNFIDSIKVDPNPTLPQNPILEDSVLSYVCNGISRASNGDYLIVGAVTNDKGAQLGKAIFAKVSSSNFTIDIEQLYPVQANPSNNKFVFKAIVEIEDAQPLETNYLIIADRVINSETFVNLFHLNASYNDIGSDELKNFGNSKSIDIRSITGTNEYRLLSASEGDSYIINILSGTNGFFSIGGGERIKTKNSLEGVSLNYTINQQIIVSSNITESGSAIPSSLISEIVGAGNTNWQRVFGTEFPYESGEVISLTDGSIVYTGTAGLKDQSKVFLIKLKSNGDMK